VGDRETILGEIAQQQAMVERLDRECEQARERLRAFEASLGDDTASTVAATSPTTSAGKIALFRSLFRGGADVYPRYWENPAPAVVAMLPPARTSGCAGYVRSRE